MGKKNNIELLNYEELLERLKSHKRNHLLLGNGFNNSLGINTSYKNIFGKMKELCPIYVEIEGNLDKHGFDIEKLIDELVGHIQEDGKQGCFLRKFIGRKVKMDFMKATNDIVQKSIKKVYQCQNEGINLLLKNFTNYFTLNYDPFLYLLLLKFKKDSGDNKAFAFSNTELFQKGDMDEKQNDIYSRIQGFREGGKITFENDGADNKVIDLNKVKKSSFTRYVKDFFKTEGWNSTDIGKVCDKIWQEENKRPVLDVDDGFQGSLFNKEWQKQNLYFLHGSFHIVNKAKKISKIEAKQNKSFCEKLEKEIDAENSDIVCVLKGKSKEKEKAIHESTYLKKCFDDLGKIDGSLVILGSSLDENDAHIFSQIKKSNVSNIYISSCPDKAKDDLKKASEWFKDKEISLFDYETISYKDSDEMK